MTKKELLKMAAREFGRMGGLARKDKLGKRELSTIGVKAANVRWDKWRKANPHKVKAKKKR